MRLLLGTFFTLVVGATVGLGATYLALTHDIAFGGMTIGSWTAYPKRGTVNIDPYSHAEIMRTGRLPIALGDGVTFIARHDDKGRPLDGRCVVVITGITPTARYWTLTLYTDKGELVPNAVHRHGFTSEAIVRRSDGSLQIVVAPHVEPGNWLPTGGIEHYLLALRFYDTSVGVATKEGREVPMPFITTRSCP